jgi:flavin-binding protein dodecin
LESRRNPYTLNRLFINERLHRYVFSRRKVDQVSTYKVIELVGTSPKSWEEAVASAIETAGKSLRDLRIAEVADLDVVIQDGKVSAFRAKVKVSFKYSTE